MHFDLRDDDVNAVNRVPAVLKELITTRSECVFGGELVTWTVHLDIDHPFPPWFPICSCRRERDADDDVGLEAPQHLIPAQHSSWAV